jgi:tRNA (cytidine32/uridine32-2'-O)-methyltransferase
MDPDCVDVVLVRPSRAANVAAAARALKNMGLRSLVLVSPPRGLDRAGARALAYGAWDLLDSARVAPDLRSAVAACTLVAATSAREEGRAVTRSPREFAAEAAELAAGGRVAVVFGPEATGLLNEELALCQTRIRIPTHSAQPSLNLAQAVLLVAYELRLAALPPAPSDAPAPRAPAGAVEQALDDLRDGLLAINYLNPASPEPILSELRGLFLRAAVTTREVSLLRGMARQIRWAGDRIALTRTENDNRGAAGGASD